MHTQEETFKNNNNNINNNKSHTNEPTNQPKHPQNKISTKSCKARQEKQLILITAMVPTQISSISDASERESREKKYYEEDEKKFFIFQFDFFCKKKIILSVLCHHNV